jgi:FlgN protein
MPTKILWCDELIAILQRQHQQYEHVITLLDQKQQALVANRLDDLLALDAELRALRHGIVLLDQERQACLQAHRVDASLRLEVLIDRYQAAWSPAQTAALRHVHTQLLADVIQFKTLHGSCERLVVLALNWVQDTIALIGQEEPSASNGYSEHGQALKGFTTLPKPLATDHRA